MAFDSLGRYNPTHKTWDHVGNMIPVVEHSEGIRPHGEFRPAPWLPVQFFDKYYEDYFVVMPGKILAFDNDGFLVPAQYGLASAQITYSSTDVEAGVYDVRTGALLLIGAVGTFNVSAVTAYMGRTGEALAVSSPAGVAPYAYWQWAGDASGLDDGFNPGGFRRHNYQLQHRTAILCDYVLELPLVPATESTPEALTEDTNADNVSTMNALGNLPVAKNTVRTPFTFTEGAGAPGDVDTRFVVEKDAAADIVSAGDWHVDLTTGVISVYSTGAIGATDYEVTYSHYASAPTGSNVSKFASALGDLKAGDFVKCNADSNFIAATTEDFKDIVGQVLEVEDIWGKDALDRVRTAYPSIQTDASGSLPGYAGQMDQMPGTANGGVSDKVHYAGASNLVVRVNLISR
jgi:hypothetical protein